MEVERGVLRCRVGGFCGYYSLDQGLGFGLDKMGNTDQTVL